MILAKQFELIEGYVYIIIKVPNQTKTPILRFPNKGEFGQ